MSHDLTQITSFTHWYKDYFSTSTNDNKETWNDVFSKNAKIRKDPGLNLRNILLTYYNRRRAEGCS
jgi:hypothetical protein